MTWRDGTAIAIISAALFIVSLVATSFVVARIPADYFNREKPHLWTRIRQSTPLAALGLIAKNVVGFALFLAGIAMLVLPGQGLLRISATSSS